MRFRKINLKNIFGDTSYNSREIEKRESCDSSKETVSCMNRAAVREGNDALWGWEQSGSGKASTGRQITNGACGGNNGCAQHGAGQRSANDSQSMRNPSGVNIRRVPCSSGEPIQDRGNAPVVFNLEETVTKNPNFRVALWTGRNLQLTTMSIPVGGEIGLEIHDAIDQFVGVISGKGEVVMGKLKSNLPEAVALTEKYAVIIPAGTYHNIKNTGNTPLKVYSIYAPKAHPFGTVEKQSEG